jgi:amino acid transporter
MAEQGQLPPTVSATHKRFHTPHVAILFSAVGMLVLALSGTFASAATLSTIIRLTTYAATCAALPVLRRKSGHEQAPFAVPGGATVSVGALILIAWLFSSSPWREMFQAAGAGAVGLLLYVLLAPRRHRARYELGPESAGQP